METDAEAASFIHAAAPPGSAEFYALLFAPAQARDSAGAWYALRRELEETASSSGEVAGTKMGWWHEELERFAAGQPRHPLTRLLTRNGIGVEKGEFHALLTAAARQASSRPWVTEEDFSVHLANSGGVLQSLVSASFGPRQPATGQAARALGAALQRVALLRDLRPAAIRGRPNVPLEAMDAAGADLRALSAATSSGPVRTLVAAQAATAGAALAGALEGFAAVDRARQRSLLVLGRIHLLQLDRLARCGHAILENDIKLHPLRQLWLAWRTARDAVRSNEG